VVDPAKSCISPTLVVLQNVSYHMGRCWVPKIARAQASLAWGTWLMPFSMMGYLAEFRRSGQSTGVYRGSQFGKKWVNWVPPP